MRKLTVRQRVEKWLKTYGHLLNKTAIERELSISIGVLQKHLKYGKKLNDLDIKKLNNLIKVFSKINNEND